MARGNMTFVQKMTLNPFQKYSRFNRFPWKFLIHLALIVFTSYQAMSIVNAQQNHARVQQQVFSSIYLGNDDGSNSIPFYNVNDFKDHLQGIFQSTKNLNDVLLQYAQTQNTQMHLQVYYQQQNTENTDRMIFDIDMSQGTINQPFNLTDNLSIKLFLAKIQSMSISLNNIITKIQQQNQQTTSCLNWTINLDYSFQSYANVQAQLSAQSNTCFIQDKQVGFSKRGISIDIIVFILSISSLLLHWQSIYKYQTEKKIYQQRTSMLGKTPQQFQFYDSWFFIGIIGNFIQSVGAVIVILDNLKHQQYQIFQTKQTLVGFGTLFAWVTILKYLQYTQSMNLMTGTLSKAWKNIFMFLLGVMPFFLGFVFLGQCIFWKYTKFQDTTSTIITLFSLSNGDIVNDTFLQVWAQGFVGQIYLIIFMILFYTAVQNVFITIIMEGYQQSIKQKQYKKAIQDRQQQQRSKFQKSILDDNQKELINQIKQQQQDKLQTNFKRIDKVLIQMQRIVHQVQQAGLPNQQEKYLLELYQESLDNLSRNLKFQIHSLSK